MSGMTAQSWTRFGGATAPVAAENGDAFLRGTRNGEKSAARLLARELENRDASATEQILFRWLANRGVPMVIVNERWQLDDPPAA